MNRREQLVFHFIHVGIIHITKLFYNSAPIMFLIIFAFSQNLCESVKYS